MAHPRGVRRPRILFLDAYDSFANNITALLATLLNADVHVLPIDDARVGGGVDAFRAEAACYDAVVCGPGPGSPDCAVDIGLMQHVWAATTAATATPALGICLGFQSLVTAHGGRVRRLRAGGLHGMVRAVEAQPKDIFANIPQQQQQQQKPFRATLYHSLGADVGQDDIPEDEWEAGAKWQLLPVGSSHPQLRPLAWVEEPLSTTTTERILMGVRHATLPFWGLQYHPESVCTDAASHAVLVNWFWGAVQWNVEHGRLRAEPGPQGLLARQATRPSLLSMQPSVLGGGSGLEKKYASVPRYMAQTIPMPAHVEVPDLVEMLQPLGTAREHIILDSASAAVAAAASSIPAQSVGDASDTEAIRGRYSIVALDVDAAARIEYRTGDRSATLRPQHDGEAEMIPLTDGPQAIWQLLAKFHEARRAQLAPILSDTDTDTPRPPFLGGFMGYVTYEQGLADIGVVGAAAPGQAAPERGHSRPDIFWAWITRSLVVDHDRGVVFVQSLSGGDDDDAAWVDRTVRTLQASPAWDAPLPLPRKEPPVPAVVRTEVPDAQQYEALVRQCQEYIAAGESYELCLTGETHITTVRPEADNAGWALYRALRKKNPAPFASYVRLGAATLVSSSPERFLCFSGTESTPLTCSMRPMKGTVRRSSTVRTLADAEALLHVPKEEAENLMIVDLVRHDLHAVCGPGGVQVPRLLQVEPYGHVFQMVSVVEGVCVSATGIDVLAASLPPGSMTGAPKKRSCALLRDVEAAPSRRERSLYSGVVGYVCVSGRGDWSVTIRSLFRWDDETTPATTTKTTTTTTTTPATDVWHVGAGGAVTILSTPEGEREEMFTKLAGPLGVFGL